jgi:lysophospholipase L1-like esterase
MNHGNRIRVWAPSQQECEPHNLPPAPGLAGMTLRQYFRASLGGKAPRISISNEYGKTPLEIGSASMAPSLGMDRIDAARSRPVRFKGSASLALAPGASMWSDPVDLEIADLMDLAVSLSVRSCPEAVTAHPGSRTSSFIVPGDATAIPAMPGAVLAEHWYLLSGLDVAAEGPCGLFIALGDSLTDGRGTTTDGNTRWTDVFMSRLRAEGRKGIAVVNAGLGGNRLLKDGLGPCGVSRFERDALDPDGARWLVLFEGVNDIGTLVPEMGADAVAKEITDAYSGIIGASRSRGVKVFGATITPFGGSQYDKPENERARKAVNAWIRDSGAFDAVFDFDAAVRDPASPERLDAAADSGDFLHLNNEGYRRLAARVDTGLLAL